MLKDLPKILCVVFLGRLGNELFQFASTLGLALAQNRTPVFVDAKVLPKVKTNKKKEMLPSFFYLSFLGVVFLLIFYYNSCCFYCHYFLLRSFVLFLTLFGGLGCFFIFFLGGAVF